MSNANHTKNRSVLESFLFGFTRILALGGSLFAIIGIVWLLFNLFGNSDQDKFVSLSDLSLTQDSENEDDTVSPKFEIHRPENVMEYLSGENDEVFYDWLEPLNENDQRDFVENLSAIITEAEKNDLDVVEVINKYKEVKLEKLQQTGSEKYESIAKKAAAIGAIFGLVLFISLMSLILVMLAIERNTRRSAL